MINATLSAIGLLTVCAVVVIAVMWAISAFLDGLSRYVLNHENKRLKDRISYLEAQLAIAERQGHRTTSQLCK